jgi:hypothetical protein
VSEQYFIRLIISGTLAFVILNFPSFVLVNLTEFSLVMQLSALSILCWANELVPTNVKSRAIKIFIIIIGIVFEVGLCLPQALS